MDLVREVLGPYVVAADEYFQDVLIRAADGHEAEVDINEVCLAVSRFPPGRFFDILAELVDRLGASVTLMDRPVILRKEEDRAHLPVVARQGAVVVSMTGRAIEGFATGS
ncbi:hypothetical protein [Streptomyces sp. WMMC940]|uniref:hypothetical protein n=1 Tax=Streptomyces sp. WMMC940 TaxID=3015153 RepID=UPI0022B7301E|nr:hypothetical protein [Streptomyces sp. WMMC940]MCZ7459321.1 hypothetical protein [Streptomyces sp. WMMC940]